MNLRKVTFNDWKMLLDWRNDTETRANSHNAEIVKEERHKEWLQSMLENKNRKLFIAMDQGIPVGTVRADLDVEKAVHELSWTVAPDFRGKGYGKKMVRLLLEEVKGKASAEVKKGNVSSMKIAESAGLTLRNEENGVLYYVNY